MTLGAGHSTDRRAALKERHRRAIVDAASSLINERGSARFSVDDLAERADVSRRTVFNHFSSLNDVVLTACTEVLTVVIDDFEAAATAAPEGDGSRAAMFEQIAQTLRGADLPNAIRYIASALGDAPEHDPRAEQLVQHAFSRTADQLTAELSRRNPAADALDIELLVSSLVQGVVVIAKHWVLTTDRTDPDGDTVWDGLLSRLIDSVRAGYMPEH